MLRAVPKVKEYTLAQLFLLEKCNLSVYILVINSVANHTLLVCLMKGVDWMRIPALNKKESPKKNEQSSWWKVVKVFFAKEKFYRLPPRK